MQLPAEPGSFLEHYGYRIADREQSRGPPQ